MPRHTFVDKLAMLGGADPDDPKASDDRVRHVAVGLLIGCIAIWAFIGGTHLGMTAFHLPLPWAFIPGLIIAGVVTLIDVLITVTYLPAPTLAARVRLLAVRGMLSL